VIASDERDEERLELIGMEGQYSLYENLDVLPRAYVVYDVVRTQTDGESLAALRDPGFDYATSAVISEGVQTELLRRGVASVSVDEMVPFTGDLTLTVETSDRGVLVMSEPYYPERRVWVDGDEVPVIRANIGFMAVELSAGTHRVELRYVPTALYVGAAITLLTIVIGVLVVVTGGLRASTDSKPERLVVVPVEDHADRW
jgi:hypothetical protein